MIGKQTGMYVSSSQAGIQTRYHFLIYHAKADIALDVGWESLGYLSPTVFLY
jgi:hypothetical protein